MEEYNFHEVQDCYNKTANEYNIEFAHELDGKPFDREILFRFTKLINRNGLVVEFGAGPGHISKYLFDCGIKNIIATDISEESLNVGKKVYPMMPFEYNNMMDTKYPDRSINGIICFYGIVHFTYKEIRKTIVEWKRILIDGGRALFSFHVGDDESLRVENFLGNEKAKATWNLFNVEKILEIMKEEDVNYEEVIVRYPYKGKEHPSKRCYIQFIKE